jgi:hypothetical protein
MTKADMQSHRDAYYACISEAKSAHKLGHFRQVVTSAVSSLDHIDGMMQYERKYENKESFSIEGIDLALKYAPLLFDFETLDKLETLLKTQRRIAKHGPANLEHGLSHARAAMWEARRFWNHLESHGETRQDQIRSTLGGDQHQWRVLAEAWQEMGLVSRTPENGSYRLSLSTDMDRVALGKCPACAAVAKAPKTKFLEKRHCPKCGATVLFVLLARAPANHMQ